MNIYADSDALPRPLREVLLKTAERKRINCFFVASHAPRVPQNDLIHAVAAGTAFDGADDWIIEHVEHSDLVITADIPLADRAIAKGAEVLNTKGEFFTPANIKNAMAMRELMSELRSTFEISGGPPPFSEKHRENFTNALHRYLQKYQF